MELAGLGASIRALRSDQGLTLEALAEKSGVSRAMLSDIERGAKSPTVRVLAAISTALGCTVSQLLGEKPPGPQPPAYTVLRRKERPVTVEPRTDVERHALAPSFSRRGVEVVLLVIPGNSRTSLQPYPQGAEVHLTSVRGPVQVRLGSDTFTLDEGDSAQFRPDTEATIINGEKKAARLFVVVDTNRPGSRR
jgi:transcriptional regulator with XRE-family HTH domain